MPQPVICDVDHVEIADWLIGDCRTGDQVALCNTHFVPWAIAQADQLMDMEARYQAMIVIAAQLPPPPAEETGPPAEPKRRRAGRSTGAGAQEARAALDAAQEAPEADSNVVKLPTTEGVAGPPSTPDDG